MKDYNNFVTETNFAYECGQLSYVYPLAAYIVTIVLMETKDGRNLYRRRLFLRVISFLIFSGSKIAKVKIRTGTEIRIEIRE